MLENNQNDIALNLDDLEGVSGGAGSSQRTLHCPVHLNQKVTRHDHGRYEGGNLTRYQCAKCSRLFSLGQVQGIEDLTIDYTNIKFD